MQFGKIRRPSGDAAVVLVEDGEAFVLDLSRRPGLASLAELLALPDPVAAARELVDLESPPTPRADCRFLAPVDRQEVWAAGVTYKRSKVAREEESKGAAQFYDKVYSAARPELFFKSIPEKVVGPGQPVRIRADSKWNVPEPELALVVSPDLRIVGYTVGNDMSSRDIEGENPLYLPQAKVYKESCALGPVITLAAGMPPLTEVGIRLVITRDGATAFEGGTTLAAMARTPESLVGWLGRDNEFPHGVVLLTGTGVVPPDDFTLQSGDEVAITIDGIGTMANRVA